MFLKLSLVCLALVCDLASAASPVSSCQDLDTNGCHIFQSAKPDLCSDPGFAQGSCKRFCGNCPIECYNCPHAVLDPDDCNVTSVCAAGMACMTKQLRASDGHHEYILTCEKKEVCDGLTFGFIGKRSVDDDVSDDEEADSAGGRAERNIAIDCCNTDFCNYPLMTTTTALPPPTTLPAGHCLRDIVFAIDDSGSVGHTNFQHALEFVEQIVSQLDIGQNSAHVSVMAYSNHPQIEWYLNTHQTKSEIRDALQHNVPYRSGTTKTGEALQAIRTQIFTSANGDRPGVENAVVILTDGQSVNSQNTIAEATALKDVSKDIISIGVGKGTDPAELAAMATDQNHVFSINGYPYLPQIVPQIKNILCS